MSFLYKFTFAYIYTQEFLEMATKELEQMTAEAAGGSRNRSTPRRIKLEHSVPLKKAGSDGF